MTGVLCVQPPGQAFAVLFSAGAGILCVLALPKSWLAPVAAPADRSQPVERARYPAAATRLEAVAQSLSSLAETVNDVYNALPHRCESYRWVIDNTHDSLCFNCGRREQCWKQEYAATLEGMEALRPLLEENGRLEPAQLPGQLSRCIHPAALCAAAARSFALYRSRKESRLHAEAMRTVFTEQYSAVAEALAVLGSSWAVRASRSPTAPTGWRRFHSLWAARRWNARSRWMTWAAPMRRSPCRAPGSARRSWRRWPARWSASAAARWKRRRCCPARA